VAAAGRRTKLLDDLVTAHPDQVEAITVDVTDTAAATAAATNVIKRYGRIDVLVNNAGRTQVGAVEETTEEELRALFDLHFFAPAALTRAVLPHMRAQGRGAIVMMSSMGGQGSFAGFSAYSATKFALEGFSEGLADEVAPHGVTVLIVEPGAFRTNLFGPGAAYFSEPMIAYADTVGTTRRLVETGDGGQPGDPAKAAAAILTALEADPTPLRLPLGDDAVQHIRGHLAQISKELDEWEPLARHTTLDSSAMPSSG
jgi:NAD(P)-dependent dehydrogenase (short-subunit alcohol dehydrogenase family)